VCIKELHNTGDERPQNTDRNPRQCALVQDCDVPVPRAEYSIAMGMGFDSFKSVVQGIMPTYAQ